MDIIIKTSFENIRHSISFRDTIKDGAESLVTSEHVLNVEEHRKDGKIYLIQASLIRKSVNASRPTL